MEKNYYKEFILILLMIINDFKSQFKILLMIFYQWKIHMIFKLY